MIRDATPGDVPALLGLIASYYAHDGIAFDEARQGRAARALIDHPDWGRFRVVDRGGLVAYAALTLDFSVEYGGRDLFVDELFVDAAHRGQGLGAALLDDAVAFGRALGCVAINLAVEQDNAGARAFYARWGFPASTRLLLSRRLT